MIDSVVPAGPGGYAARGLESGCLLSEHTTEDGSLFKVHAAALRSCVHAAAVDLAAISSKRERRTRPRVIDA